MPSVKRGSKKALGLSSPFYTNTSLFSKTSFLIFNIFKQLPNSSDLSSNLKVVQKASN